MNWLGKLVRSASGLKREWKVAEKAEAYRAEIGDDQEPPTWRPGPELSDDDALSAQIEVMQIDCPVCGAAAGDHCRRMRRDDPAPTDHEKAILGKWAERSRGRKGEILAVEFHQGRRDAISK